MNSDELNFLVKTIWLFRSGYISEQTFLGIMGKFPTDWAEAAIHEFRIRDRQALVGSPDSEPAGIVNAAPDIFTRQ